MRKRAVAPLLVFVLCLAGQAFADEVVNGQLGPGALYRLVRPTNWNGRLLLYAHGDVAPEDPVALPLEADVLVALLAPQGIAVAYSSFSENGWAVKDGAQRTHQLLGIFTAKFGQPSHVYIGGASMGGLIAIDLVERFPGKFAGALPACAVAGGTRLQFDYAANVRALFDLLYPNVLPGSAVDLPPGTDVLQDIVGAATNAMIAFPTGAFTIAAIDQTPVPWANPAELIESIATALALNTAGQLRLLPLTQDHAYFDNRHTIYAVGGTPLPAINLAVERFDASPSALAYMRHYYEPSGDLRVPMLMLSNSRDPVAPGFHRQAYADAAAAAGRADLLVQRDIPSYAHCDFTPLEIGTAFTDLVGWVEFGVKPLP